MSDYEAIKKLLSRLKDKGFPIDESPPPRSISPENTRPWEFDPETKVINIRVNGFIFDKDGNLIDAWAEYD